MYILKGYFSGLLHSYQHGSGKISLLYANVCLLLRQQSKTMTNTVQNILQNNLECTLKKYAVSITWQTQAQQATTDGKTDLNLTFLSNTDTT